MEREAELSPPPPTNPPFEGGMSLDWVSQTFSTTALLSLSLPVFFIPTTTIVYLSGSGPIFLYRLPLTGDGESAPASRGSAVYLL